jgi:sugar-specific transcriptional regulator TrmB
MGPTPGVDQIEKLGLTRVEAEVYVHLVQNSPATGYAIAKAIGRTQGATYKVLSSLESRGAVVVEEGAGRRCRAVPPEEFLDQLEEQFRDRKRLAGEALRDLKPAPGDERIYRLSTVAQVQERCRRMLEAAEVTALADMTPGVLDTLRAEIEGAIGRGVRVWIQLYEPREFSGAKTTRLFWADEVLRRLPVEFAYLMVDGKEQVIASYSRDGAHLHHATWTANLYLTWLFGSYVKQNMVGTELERLLDGGATAAQMKKVREEWKEHMPEFITPGYREVKKRFGLEFVEGE